MAGKAVQSGKTGQTGNRGGRAAESCCGTGNAAETVRTSAETVHGEEYRPLRKGNIGEKRRCRHGADAAYTSGTRTPAMCRQRSFSNE